MILPQYHRYKNENALIRASVQECPSGCPVPCAAIGSNKQWACAPPPTHLSPANISPLQTTADDFTVSSTCSCHVHHAICLSCPRRAVHCPTLPHRCDNALPRPILRRARPNLALCHAPSRTAWGVPYHAPIHLARCSHGVHRSTTTHYPSLLANRVPHQVGCAALCFKCFKHF